MEPVLDEFLGELSCLLPVRGSERARALAELEDHLLCAVEEGLAEGQSRPDAVAASLSRVGGARAVAASFARPRAEHAVARAQQLTATCVLAFLVLFTLASQVTGRPAHHTIGAGAAAAVGWFAWQIAGAAGIVAWLHSRRSRAGDLCPSALALSLRAAAVAVACVLLALATDVVTLAGSQLSSRAGQGVAGGIGAAAAITAVTVCFLCRCRQRAQPATLAAAAGTRPERAGGTSRSRASCGSARRCGVCGPLWPAAGCPAGVGTACGSRAAVDADKALPGSGCPGHAGRRWAGGWQYRRARLRRGPARCTADDRRGGDCLRDRGGRDCHLRAGARPLAAPVALACSDARAAVVTAGDRTAVCVRGPRLRWLLIAANRRPATGTESSGDGT